jgi:hypothetical protein
MVKNYEVIADKKTFKVRENKTQFIIKKFSSKTKASKLAEKLNSGFGFAGETPSFFINKAEQ